jgi:hypothetical protein
MYAGRKSYGAGSRVRRLRLRHLTSVRKTGLGTGHVSKSCTARPCVQTQVCGCLCLCQTSRFLVLITYPYCYSSVQTRDQIWGSQVWTSYQYQTRDRGVCLRELP